MKEVKIGVRKFRVVECWKDCSEEQLRTLVLCGVYPAERRDRGFWELVVKTGLGCDEKFWKGLTLSLDQWEQLKRCFDWVFEEKIVKRPFDFLEVDGVKYFLAKDGFDDTKAIELSVGAMYFQELTSAEPDENTIDLLLAVFCKPERKDLKSFRLSEEWDGDIREPYNEQRVIERAEVFKGVEFWQKVAFLQWWQGQFMEFVEQYADVFGGSKDEEARYLDGRGWVMLLKNVANKGYFGALAGVHKTNVHTVWSYLLDDVLDNKDLKDKQNG